MLETALQREYRQKEIKSKRFNVVAGLLSIAALAAVDISRPNSIIRTVFETLAAVANTPDTIR